MVNIIHADQLSVRDTEEASPQLAALIVQFAVGCAYSRSSAHLGGASVSEWKTENV